MPLKENNILKMNYLNIKIKFLLITVIDDFEKMNIKRNLAQRIFKFL